MAKSHSISKDTWKRTKKLFHLLDLTILNSYILYKFCSGNMTHLKFREQLVGDLVFSHEESIEIHGAPRCRASSSETQMSRLDIKHALHWPVRGKEER
jgi:hypothetical protein